MSEILQPLRFCGSVHVPVLYLYSYRSETARQLRMYAQLTRCFSAVAELLVLSGSMAHRNACPKVNRFICMHHFTQYDCKLASYTYCRLSISVCDAVHCGAQCLRMG